jgi:hypothetical protein
VEFQRFKSHGVTAAIKHPDGVVLRLGAPSSFMNRSGTPVQAMLAFHKIPPSQLIVVRDDHTTLAGGGDQLVFPEAEAANISDSADDATLIHRAMRLCSIFDNMQVVAAGNIQDGIHVSGQAVEVHRDNGFGF